MLTEEVTACWAQLAVAMTNTPCPMRINQHAAEFLFCLMQHSNQDRPLYIDNDPLPLILRAVAAAGSGKR